MTYVTRLPRAQVSLSARRAWIEIDFTGSAWVSELSLSARRAWIEILSSRLADMSNAVALRKESVDRNIPRGQLPAAEPPSLSARRAWIEIANRSVEFHLFAVALRKESVDRNREQFKYVVQCRSRSPQGERG